MTLKNESLKRFSEDAGRLAQLVRALSSHGRSHWFESSIAHTVDRQRVAFSRNPLQNRGFFMRSPCEPLHVVAAADSAPLFKVLIGDLQAVFFCDGFGVADAVTDF